ncbi:GagPol-like protein, partial [Leptotrombidium deliense]
MSTNPPPTLQIPIPAPMNFNGNVNQDWKRFHREFTVYSTASRLKDCDTEQQQATFLAIAGSEAQRIFTTLTVNPKESDKLKAVIDAFETYCKSRCNVTFARFTFNKRMQREGETFDSFLTDIRILAKDCDYSTVEESLLTDRIVIGVRDDTLRANLLRKSKLSLKDAIDMCRASESSASQVREIT